MKPQRYFIKPFNSIIMLMKKNKQFSILLLTAGMLLLSACSTNDDSSDSGNSSSGGNAAFGSSGTSTAADASALDIEFYTGALTETEVIPTDATTEAYNDYIENDADYATGWANTIYVTYNGTNATVEGIADGDADFTVSVSGAHVTITAMKKAHYVLSGSSSDGSLTIDGAEKKAWVTFQGLTLTSTSGAVLSKTTDKRLYIEVTDGTTNSLTDASGDHKSAVFSAGKIAISGSGSLTVTGNAKNCIQSSDYIRLRPYINLTLRANANNAIRANDSIVVEGGTINATVGAAGYNGLSADMLVKINGGVQNIGVASTAGKGVSSDGIVEICGGRLIVITSGGGTWDSTDNSTSTCSGVKADVNYIQTGGEVYLKSTGNGGKGISSDADTYIYGGTVRIVASGSKYTYGGSSSSNYSSAPKGIKADGNLTISGGDIAVVSTNHEGIESKGTINISDGYLYVSAGDDAINSAGNFTISGGTVMGYSTGNDGLDANGNFYITGGNVFAIGQSSPEVAIDANSEGGYKLYVTGGNIIAIGGLESGASLSQTCYQASSYNKNAWYALYRDGTLAFAFKVPSGNMGSPMAVSTSGTPTLYSDITTTGSASWIGYGNSGASGGSQVSLSSYTGGSGMGGGMGGNPGGAPGFPR